MIMPYKIVSFFFLLTGLLVNEAFSQTFKTVDQAKEYFVKLDDVYNQAMVSKDSLFFRSHFADAYINCTPIGTIENKEPEIKVLISLPLAKVERVAPEYDVFTYSNELATYSVVKKLTMKDGTVSYVRRTTVYKLLNGKWQAISGQGTRVLPEYVNEETKQMNK
jgi:hypothetical protein